MVDRDGEDPVLAMAIDLLTEMICECAHLESDHAFVDVDSSAVYACHGDQSGHCGCQEFRSVEFHVERAVIK